MKPDIVKLETLIGVTFSDKLILLSAITHRSFLNENREAKQDHNERLEFLGDAVLELVVTDYLYNRFEDKTEGELTAIRAALVNTNTLSDASTILGVNEYLLLSKGEAKDMGRARQYILANTFESLVGALYTDQGYDAAKAFIATHLFPRTDMIIEKKLWQDAKSRFQEKAQEMVGVTPLYQTIRETGPDHDRVFTVGAYLKNELIGEGTGRAKQEAEQMAAERALDAKGW